MLLIDIGNTRAKACMYTEGRLCLCDDIAEAIDGAEEIAVCSVGPVHPEIEERLRGHRVWRLTTACPEARRFVPDIPEGYGVDRLAADIGAAGVAGEGFCGKVLVVDVGTCITYDLLGIENGRAEILGGTISPGIRLRLEAMHCHTEALPLLSADGPAPVVGHDTETCMRGGAVNGARWEIEGYIRTVRVRFPDVRVFMTGGDVPVLPDDLAAITTVDPLLLFRGMGCIFG